jgi:hypothetical protein
MTSDSASRVTRSRRNLWLALAVFASCLAVAGMPRAQETAVEPERAADAAESAGTPADPGSAGVKRAPAEVDPGTADSASGSGDAQKGTDEDSTATKPTPADSSSKPAKSGTTPGRFEPTEKVRADFDVSFPVDI